MKVHRYDVGPSVSIVSPRMTAFSGLFLIHPKSRKIVDNFESLNDLGKAGISIIW